ncbi:Oidioi.mRNA.OKI2018_I69.chr2.g7432.t1.cds [Oikopleura dioica]|uniref:Oidioi.mRNA.OKI2018_I69.chr2.g7432.t1.cds n=1 Tax=Oikopleura dioica TaxID=34765 RepID=A0ABN7TF59_OIKDI|nr:Oidioi.mRNA.OKI2018_I69.chr2.g7432.t1.cds [Oikopleura dioica]
MSIRLDQITEDDVGNSRQKKKSKVTKKEESVDLDALLMAGENLNKENTPPSFPKRSVGSDWSDSEDEAPPPPKRSTRATKAKAQDPVKTKARGKTASKAEPKPKKKKTVKEQVSEEDEEPRSPMKKRTRAGRAKAAEAPKKESKSKKAKATKEVKSKYFKAEADDNQNDTPQPEESDEEAPAPKKAAKGRKKPAPKRKKVKEENESDWSESDKEEEKPKPKAKAKKRGAKKEAEEKEDEAPKGPHVEGTYLDDGTLQIEITEAKKNRFIEEYKETPEERQQREWAAYMRSIINREKREHSQERHRIDLLVHLWLGLSWDKHIDCKFLQANILSMLPIDANVDSEADLRRLTVAMNSSFHFPAAPADSGIPSPHGGLLLLDRALQRYNCEDPWWKNKSITYQYFLRTCLFVAANEEIRRMVSKHESSVILNSWCEVFIGETWLPVIIKENRFAVVETKNVEGFLYWPVKYCMGFDGGVRDVTARYASKWLEDTKKLRIKYVEKNTNYWKETCDMFPSRNKHLETAETKEMNKNLKSAPIPKTISALKGHPLYVLRRHVLKYECIYPEDTTPVGQIELKSKGEITYEDIFPRKAVKKLHTRGTWLQNARVVRDGEVPMKMVASWMQNKKAGNDAGAKNSPLFGEWQTDWYKAPIAKDGLVPRNDFGNVDLYQMCMLPIGTVFLEDLDDFGVCSRVCRKLGIDAAKAVVGFDGKKGYPKIGGYVICKEYEQTVRDAYVEAAGISEERARQKSRSRAKKNWRKLLALYFAKKKVERLFAGREVDPQLERVIMKGQRRKMDLEDESSDEEIEKLEKKASATTKKRAPTKSSGRGRNKVKIVDDDTIESIESENEEPEASSDSSDESDDDSPPAKLTKKLKQQVAKTVIPRERSSRRAKAAPAKPVKYEFSGSESSEFSAESNDEDWD